MLPESMRRFLRRPVTGALVAGLMLLFAVSGVCEVTFDGSSVARGRTDSLAGPNYNIQAGMGTQFGTNLFHSFSKFNILTGESATFNDTGATGPIVNVLSRVTGGSQSFIDGLLRCTITGAHFFLINPSGVMIGPNASLDMSGSLHISTADYLRMSDGKKFYADLGRDSVLSSAPVAAFGFLTNTPASISVTGMGGGAYGNPLSLPSGETLSLIGGNVQIKDLAWLLAEHGQINVAAVASPGEVIINQPGQPPFLDVSSFKSLGTVTMSHGAILDVSGANDGSTGSGTIIIRAGRLEMVNSFLNAYTIGDVSGNPVGIDVGVSGRMTMDDGAQIVAQTWGAGDGGSIVVRAGELQMQGGLDGGSLINSATMGGPGRGGNITVNVDNGLSLLPWAQIGANTQSAGPGGNVTVTAKNITIQSNQEWIDQDKDQFSGITAQARTSGPGGSIKIVADTLTILDAGVVSTNVMPIDTVTPAPATGGNIDIQARDISVSGVIFQSGSGTDFHSRIESRLFGVNATGIGGDIAVRADTIRLGEGGYIGTYLVDGSPGQSGNISLKAGSIGFAPRGKIETSSVLGTGNSGGITITTDQMSITGIGPSEAFLDFSGVRSDTNAGTGGNIRIGATNTLALNDAGKITSGSSGSGRGGTVEITANSLYLQNQSVISAKSSAGGDAGNITLNVGTLRSDHSAVTTEAALTDGGNITVNAGNLVNLIDSKMTASVGGGPATVGGNITIDPRYVVLNDSSVIANAYEGKGGNIRIIAAMFLSSPESLVSASSRLGIDGTVDIRAPITNISGTLVPVRGTYLQSSEMLRDRCMARLQGSSQSSLTVSGRQGLPPRPGIVLPAPVF